MFDQPSIELEVLQHAVEIIVELLGCTRLRSEAGCKPGVLVVEPVRVVVWVLLGVVVVMAGVLLDLMLGVRVAREGGRIGDRGRTARGQGLAAPGRLVGRCRQRRVDRGTVVEAVLRTERHKRAESESEERRARRVNLGLNSDAEQDVNVPVTRLRMLQTGPSREGGRALGGVRRERSESGKEDVQLLSKGHLNLADSSGCAALLSKGSLFKKRREPFELPFLSFTDSPLQARTRIPFTAVSS